MWATLIKQLLKILKWVSPLIISLLIWMLVPISNGIIKSTISITIIILGYIALWKMNKSKTQKGRALDSYSGISRGSDNDSRTNNYLG